MNWVLVVVSVIALSPGRYEATVRDALTDKTRTREACMADAYSLNNRLHQLKVYGRLYTCVSAPEVPQ